MAARLTRARKSLADESFAVPDGAELDVPGRGRRRRRLPGVHGRVRRRLGARPAARRRVGRGDPPGPGAPRRAAVDDQRQPELDALLALMLLQHSRRDARVWTTAGWSCCPTRTGRRWHQDEIAEAPRAPDAAGPRPARAVPPPGADRRRARDRADRRPHRLGADRRRATTSCSRWATPPWSGSTGRSRSPRPTGRWPGSPRSPSAALPGTGYDGVRAELLARAGLVDEARAAYDAALAACGNEAERAHLAERRQRLGLPAVPR